MKKAAFLIFSSSFFLDEKLEWMGRNDIDHAVVLNLSQLYGNGLRLEEMKPEEMEERRSGFYPTAMVHFI